MSKFLDNTPKSDDIMDEVGVFFDKIYEKHAKKRKDLSELTYILMKVVSISEYKRSVDMFFEKRSK